MNEVTARAFLSPKISIGFGVKKRAAVSKKKKKFAVIRGAPFPKVPLYQKCGGKKRRDFTRDMGKSNRER